MTVQVRTFRPAKSPRAYGYADGRPIEQPGSPSGYLLPWDVLDDEAEVVVSGRPSMYCITGETVSDGILHPEIAVTDAYMKWAGFHRDGRDWRRSA